MRRALAAAAILCVSAPAAALSAEVSIKPRVGITVLGFDAPTGGLSVGLGGRVLWELREGAGVYAGAGAEAIGLQGGWYHMGVIAGPRVGAWAQWRKLYVSAGAGLLYGQLSLCRSWTATDTRQCMRWWNGWPETGVTVAYRDDDVHIGLDITSMLLRSTWGTDGSIGLAASGSWR